MVSWKGIYKKLWYELNLEVSVFITEFISTNSYISVLMGSYSYLTISNFDVKSWKYDLPPENDPLLSFIFLSSDRVIETDKDLEKDGITRYLCSYVTTVTEVKKRFDESHFTIKEIDDVISKITGIPEDKIEIAVMDFDSYYTTLLNTFKSTEARDELNIFHNDELDELSDEKMELDDKIKISELGNYIEFRKIREYLDNSNDVDLVCLDITEIVGVAENSEDFDDIMLIEEDLKSDIKIDKRYLEMAKIHYSEYHFDLVYIELFISLESSLNRYITMKSNKLSEELDQKVELDKIFENVKFMDRIRFVVSFIGKKELDKVLMSDIKIAYNVRNNIIHNNQKKFKRKNVIKAIEDVEKIVQIINSLD